VRSNLTALSSKTLTCLEQGGDPECIVVSDVRRQEVRGGLDTDLLKTVSGGLQFGYSISDARHVSRRTSQLFLMMTFQLSLYAGDYGKDGRTGVLSDDGPAQGRLISVAIQPRFLP
jgi:hypothetical protein